MKKCVKICEIVMPSEKDNTLEFNQYMKSDKIAIHYLCWHWILNQKNRWMRKQSRKFLKNKHTSYRGEDCMKNFCTSLREHATNVINFEKKKMLPLTKKELKLHQDVTECYICGRWFLKKFTNDKDYRKIRDHCHFTGKYRDAAHSTCKNLMSLVKSLYFFITVQLHYQVHYQILLIF